MRARVKKVGSLLRGGSVEGGRVLKPTVRPWRLVPVSTPTSPGQVKLRYSVACSAGSRGRDCDR